MRNLKLELIEEQQKDIKQYCKECCQNKACNNCWIDRWNKLLVIKKLKITPTVTENKIVCSSEEFEKCSFNPY